jgi:hypothetical protein
MPALLGGLFIGVLSALPIVNFCNCCCVWIAGGGALAAYLQQQNQAAPLTVMDGVRAGVLAGAVGAFVWLLTTVALDVVLAPLQERLVEEILRNARDLPPEVRTWLESADRGAGHIFTFFVMLIFGSMAAGVGGAVGAKYFRNDVPPALGGPIPPPPLP